VALVSNLINYNQVITLVKPETKQLILKVAIE